MGTERSTPYQHAVEHNSKSPPKGQFLVKYKYREPTNPQPQCTEETEAILGRGSSACPPMLTSCLVDAFPGINFVTTNLGDNPKIHIFANSKISELDMALSGEHHIVWFEISVNDALARKGKRSPLVKRSIATLPWERSKAERRGKKISKVRTTKSNLAVHELEGKHNLCSVEFCFILWKMALLIQKNRLLH